MSLWPTVFMVQKESYNGRIWVTAIFHGVAVEYSKIHTRLYHFYSTRKDQTTRQISQTAVLNLTSGIQRHGCDICASGID